MILIGMGSSMKDSIKKKITFRCFMLEYIQIKISGSIEEANRIVTHLLQSVKLGFNVAFNV